MNAFSDLSKWAIHPTVIAPRLTGTTDSCTRCGQTIRNNAHWNNDVPFCSGCALVLAADGYQLHGSRIQNLFHNAADHAFPGLTANDWLSEEFSVVIDGHSFRADFVVRLPDIKIAVELDSFIHHSSPQALLRDRKRQRLFQKDGWIVIRFSGSEVWRNPESCVEELIEIILAIIANVDKPAAA